MLGVLASLVLQVGASRLPAPSPQAPKPPGPAASAVAPTAIRPASELAEASRRYAPVVRRCYETEGLRRDPSLSATLEVAVVIDSTGLVQRVRVDSTGVQGLGLPEVAECVKRAARTWHFSSGSYALEEPALSYRLVPPAKEKAPDST